MYQPAQTQRSKLRTVLCDSSKNGGKVLTFFRNLENAKASGGSSTDYIDLGMEIVKSVAEVDETLGPLIFVSYSSSIFFVSLALYAFSTLYFTGSFKWQALLFSVYFLVQGDCDT